jgi:hypothetical protein
LSDNLLKKDALVDAKYALKNVLEHDKDSTIIKEVNRRLEDIKEIERVRQQPKKQQEVIIDIGNEQNVSEQLLQIEEEEEDEPMDSLKFNVEQPADSLNKK